MDFDQEKGECSTFYVPIKGGSQINETTPLVIWDQSF